MNSKALRERFVYDFLLWEAFREPETINNHENRSILWMIILMDTTMPCRSKIDGPHECAVPRGRLLQGYKIRSGRQALGKSFCARRREPVRNLTELEKKSSTPCPWLTAMGRRIASRIPPGRFMSRRVRFGIKTGMSIAESASQGFLNINAQSVKMRFVCSYPF